MDCLVVEDICDQCQGEAVLFCEECQNSYCASCSLVRQRVGKSTSHSTVRISKVPNVTTHVFLEEDGLSEPQQEGKFRDIIAERLSARLLILQCSGRI